MIENKKVLTWLLIGTVLALIPEYLIRFKESIYLFFYYNFTTYPGDLWNFFSNYLSKGLHYPPEYPAGLRFFYEVFGFYKYKDYTIFFTVNSIVLCLFALATTYFLYKIGKKVFGEKFDPKRIWYFWILAPSFLFYTSINYDLPVIFLIVLAVYFFVTEKYYWAISALAVGVVMKVFPVFLLPIFIWKSPRQSWIKLAGLFAAIVILLNLPYALMDFSAWIYPYVWQISSNFTHGPDQGTYWWLIYPIAGKFTGWLSLVLFGLLYLFTCFKMRRAHFLNLCLGVILLFLLTDRIYSPQYNLYLLPFLVLATYSVNKKLFYTADILNFLIVFFCFFLKDNPVYLQVIVFLRYFALIGMVYFNFKKGSTNGIYQYTNGTNDTNR